QVVGDANVSLGFTFQYVNRYHGGEMVGLVRLARRRRVRIRLRRTSSRPRGARISVGQPLSTTPGFEKPLALASGRVVGKLFPVQQDKTTDQSTGVRCGPMFFQPPL